MPELFEPASIGTLALKNRFIRSGTWERLATGEGAVTKDLVDAMLRLVEGEVGLVITGLAAVNSSGKSGPAHLGADDEKFLPGLSLLAGAVREHGGRIVLQAGHAGCYSRNLPSGALPSGPSSLTLPDGPVCRAMTGDEIRKTIDDFCFSARLAKKAGFDGIQIHAAHGYLINEFLSPYYNRRTDSYGGSPENRERFLCEVLQSVRNAVGDRYPLLLKLNADDYLPEGFSVSQLSDTGNEAIRECVDCVELSGGTSSSPVRFWPIRPGRIREGHEGYYRRAARTFIGECSVPLALVGGIRSFETARRFVAEGTAGFISLSRPLIREPGLIRRWHSGDLRPSACLSCDCCYQRLFEDRGFACEITERENLPHEKQ